MQNIVRNPVMGENFTGRDALIRELWERLRGHHLLLLGPRRIGKTSLARRLMETASTHGWGAIEVNVADCMDESAFARKLEAAIKKTEPSWSNTLIEQSKNLLDRVKNLDLPGIGKITFGTPEKTWVAIADNMISVLAERPLDTLIYIDELPIFLSHIYRYDPIHGGERIRHFLDWFRNDLCQRPGSERLHWLISGSIGLDTLVQRLKMADSINSLRPQSLPPFSDEEARSLLDHLSASYPEAALSPEDRDYLISLIGWPQPYYLQLVFYYLRSDPRPRGQSMRAAIDETLERLILPRENADNDFHHWEERLDLQLEEEDAELSAALLTHACRTREGASATALFADLQNRRPKLTDDQQTRLFARLRDLLERDGYWRREEIEGRPHYRFLLEPLRRWWLRRHSL